MVVLNTDIQTEERFEFDPEEIALKVCEEVLKQESFPDYLFPDWILRSLPLLKTASMRAASTRIMTV